MTDRNFRRIINNPRHIPSIHNYCDRWCERCPFTLRCSVYAMEAAVDKDKPPHNRADESLWPRLEAWTAFFHHAPQFQDTALPAILTLHRLRRGIEKQFPKARPFQRPSFDTVRFPAK
jgi:hypothetical protein